jgi:ribonucleoside-diphosphate reductase alpha chain
MTSTNPHTLSFPRRFTAGPFPLSFSDVKIVDGAGRVVFEQAQVAAPAHWSPAAVQIAASKFFRKAGVPSKTTEAPGFEHIPAPLRPRIPAPDATFGPETSVFQVAHRLAGAWAYGALVGGYVSEADALVFYDEMHGMLLGQYGAPNSPQFFNTGLWWAYGIKGGEGGLFAADHHTGKVEPIATTYERPQVSACYIQTVRDDLTGDGGIMDLWTKEARVFKGGAGSGVNVSAIRGEGEPLSSGGKSSGLLSFLKAGDRSDSPFDCGPGDPR